jgi:hypothetical protein
MEELGDRGAEGAGISSNGPPTQPGAIAATVRPALRTGLGRCALAGLAALALVAFALRLAIVLEVGFNPAFFDVDGYHALALAGLSGPVPSDTHPPGYPWFLLSIYALLGPRVRVVYLLQAALSALVVFAAGWGTARRYGPAAGWLAAALLTVDGYMAIATAALASENLCIVGVAALVALLLPAKRPVSAARLIVAGGLIGGLGLVRTAMLGLAGGVVVFELFGWRPGIGEGRRRLARAVLVCAMAFAPAAVFGTVRAAREGAFRIGSPWDSYNLWLGNNPHASGRVEPMPDVPSIGSAEIPDEEARARVLRPRAIAFALGHPLRELELVARRASYLLAPPKRDLIYIYGWGWAGERSRAEILTAYVWAAASVPLLVMLLLLAWGRHGADEGLVLLALLLLFGAAPYLMSLGDARFLLPLHPLLAAGAGSLARPGAGVASRRRWGVVAVLLVLFTVNAVLDLVATQPALEAILAPGGSSLHPPYHFAR